MISVQRAKELENLVACMIENGDDAADIIATVKDTIIEVQKTLNQEDANDTGRD